MRTPLVALLLVGCAAKPPEPAALDTRNDACGSCRMAVSDARFAAQLVVPGELPVFFDDLGCARQYLKAHAPGSGAVVFVADHRTRAWVRAEYGVYTRLPGLDTPMGSRIVAHSDVASRAADPDARGGTDLRANEVFGLP
jgi:copper chaperone NosL